LSSKIVDNKFSSQLLILSKTSVVFELLGWNYWTNQLTPTSLFKILRFLSVKVVYKNVNLTKRLSFSRRCSSYIHIC